MSAESDYLMLTPEHKYPRVFATDEDMLIAKTTREFVNKEIMPKRLDLDGGWHRDENLARSTLYDLLYKSHKLGFTIPDLPEELGGSRMTPVAREMVNEEISRGDIALDELIQKNLWATSLMYNRTIVRKDLLEEFAPQLTGEVPYVACLDISEPAGGANVEDTALEFRTLRTVIAKNDGEYLSLNGQKIWPGPSGDPAYWDELHEKWPSKFGGHLGYWVVVSEDPSMGEEGVGIVHVPYDAQGMKFSEPFKKLGFTFAEENTEIWFQNVTIPKKYRIDNVPGIGKKIIRGYVLGSRLDDAPTLTGLSTAALEIALEFTKNRQIAGKPVRERSYFAAILAEMYRAIDLSRQYYLSVVWQTQHPEIYGEPWSSQMLAKFSAARSFAGDTAVMVTNRAMELCGAYGYVLDAHLEKYYRDFKIVQMWLGGPQRDRLEIAQGLYGPFEWAGFKEWTGKEYERRKSIDSTISKTVEKASGSTKEATELKKNLEKDREYDIEEAERNIWK